MAKDEIMAERLMTIAYFSLWMRRDLDPPAELPHFRKTRLDQVVTLRDKVKAGQATQSKLEARDL